MGEVQKDGNKYLPPADWSGKANIKSFEEYKKMYDRSISDPEGFWSEIADTFYWKEKWNKVREYNYDRNKGPVSIEWFKGGKTNISYNCLDRHLETSGNKTAIIWEGNDPSEQKKFTYKEVHAEVCRFANALKAKGVQKGDRVAMYMPMTPELAFAVLACARIGAIHSVVFGGFSAESLADRILDSYCKVLLTSDGVYRGKKQLHFKEVSDQAMQICADKGHKVETCIVLKRLGDKIEKPVTMHDGRDIWWHDAIADQSTDCEPEWLDAEDPHFILYTSGSTGKPKGVQHSVAGYMLYTATTFKYIFDHKPEDIYWCTADIGWITGHSYIVYGPMANAATTVMFEGVPTYPDGGRFWEVCAKHKVTVFYTAPTAIRAIACLGDDLVNKHDLSSLRLLGTVGEPINVEAWLWYHEVVGKKKCPIVDTWWQTETGGILLTTLPGAMGTKPGSAGLPMFGIEPAILEAQSGKELDGKCEGVLAFKRTWPGQMRTVYGDHKRFEETYFAQYNGYYFTGDGCWRDEDGYYRITGRVDDVINVSGHRLGTAEVESALDSHDSVAEAAVVGYPHDVKGQGIYAYVTLNQGQEYTDTLKSELVKHVRTKLGPIATPDVVHWAKGLPKTRSGKIMRRILRKIAAGETDQLGDTTTLADPAVVDLLLAEK